MTLPVATVTGQDEVMRVEWLTVGGEPDAWAQIGLIVHDGLVPLFGTGVRIEPELPPGLHGWALSAPERDDGLPPSIDGLRTDTIEPAAPLLVEHPVGAIDLDHVVVSTDSLDRTCAAIAAATNAPLKRIRDLGEIRQGFHRIGGLIVEVVERAGQPVGPASFWGLVLNVEDLDHAYETLGPDVIGEPRDAVQPGRRIATVRGEAGLGLPVALMTPDPRR